MEQLLETFKVCKYKPIINETTDVLLQINTFGHMLAFKHFTPLLPGKSAKLDYSDDPANGLIKPNLSVLASMTARVSIVNRFVLDSADDGRSLDRLDRRQQ